MVDILNSKWSEMDAGNDGASPDGIQGGYAPSTVAPTMRSSRGANKRQAVQHNAFYTSTGSSNAYVLTYAQAPEQIFKGQKFAFFANHTNTGAATLNINGFGAKAIVHNDTIAALKAGQIINGMAVIVYYDGTRFRLVSSSKADPDFTGTLTASLFSGSGASLTNLNASNLASGTVPNARISGAYDGITTLSQTGLHTITVTGEALRLAGPAAADDPFISFYAGGSRTAYIQHTDGTSDGSGLRLFNDVTDDYLYLSNVNNVDALKFYDSSRASHDIVLTEGNLTSARVTTALGYTPVSPAISIVAGNGLSGGGTLGASRTVTLGTPGSVSGSSTNSVTATSHTHELVLASADITGGLGYTPANSGISIVAGNGLTGGGTLGASRTVALGTPGTITATSTNSVSATSHTHDVDWGGGFAAVAAGAIGSLVFASYSGTLNYGSSVAGSSLFPGATNSGANDVRATALSGTYRCLGFKDSATGLYTVYVRIS